MLKVVKPEEMEDSLLKLEEGEWRMKSCKTSSENRERVGLTGLWLETKR